jgi:hypothetical protein
MRLLFCLFLIFGYVLESKCQEKQKLSEAIVEVSDLWKLDSLSCKGYRGKIAKKLFDARNDSVKGKQIFKYLGKPNHSGHVFLGNVHKTFALYTYYVYRDNCPKVMVEGLGIEFLVDEIDDSVFEVSEINWCG